MATLGFRGILQRRISRFLLLLESGVGENNAHHTFCVRGNPAPVISMLLERCQSDQRRHPKDERFFRHRVHSRRERIASTLNSGARGLPDAPRGPMSVIFANTGTPKIPVPPTFQPREAAVFFTLTRLTLRELATVLQRLPQVSSRPWRCLPCTWLCLLICDPSGGDPPGGYPPGGYAPGRYPPGGYLPGGDSPGECPPKGDPPAGDPLTARSRASSRGPFSRGPSSRGPSSRGPSSRGDPPERYPPEGYRPRRARAPGASLMRGLRP